MSGEYKFYKESYKVREKTTWVHVVFSLKIKYQQILSLEASECLNHKKKDGSSQRIKYPLKTENNHTRRFTDKQVSDLYPCPRQ